MLREHDGGERRAGTFVLGWLCRPGRALGRSVGGHNNSNDMTTAEWWLAIAGMAAADRGAWHLGE